MSQPTFLTFRKVGPSPDEFTVNTADIVSVKCTGVDPARTDERQIVVTVRLGLLVEGFSVYRGHEPEPLLQAIKRALRAVEPRAE